MVVLLLVFLRKLHMVFDSDCTNFHHHQPCTRFLFFPHPHQYLSSVFFLIIAILIGMRCFLIVVLICISLMISDVEHFFMCLLAICLSSLGKCLFMSSAHILIKFFFDVSLYELFIHIRYEPLIGHITCKYFLPFNRLCVFLNFMCVCVFSVISFAVQNF